MEKHALVRGSKILTRLLSRLSDKSRPHYRNVTVIDFFLEIDFSLIKLVQTRENYFDGVF